MDINTNVSQQSPTTVSAIKAASGKASADAPVPFEVDVVSKTALRLTGNNSVTQLKVKDSNDKDGINLKKAVDDLNDFIQNTHRDLQFSIDDKSGTLIVKVIDSKTEKVIRQIPNEETLRLARSLAEDKSDATLNIFSSRA